MANEKLTISTLPALVLSQSRYKNDRDHNNSCKSRILVSSSQIKKL